MLPDRVLHTFGGRTPIRTRIQEDPVSIAKVIEVLAEGSSIENAIESAVEEAGRTVRNIKNVYIADMQAIVRDGKVKKYRVNTRITFVVGDDD